jgi:hypothetical protein
MKKITAAVALMCALSAYVSYPSATVSGRATPSLALSMQESRSLPIEAYDAVWFENLIVSQGAMPIPASRLVRFTAQSPVPMAWERGSGFLI